MSAKHDQSAQVATTHFGGRLLNAEACKLRFFEANGDESTGSVFLKVGIQHRQKLGEMAKGNPEQFAGLVRAAWALVLRCYTGMDNVCFGYQEAIESRRGFAEPIVQVHLDETSTLGELVHDMRPQYQHSRPAGELAVGCVGRYPYNTAVELRGSHDVTTAAIQEHHNHVCLRVELAAGDPNVFLDFESSAMSIEEACGLVATLRKTLADVLCLPACKIGQLDYMSEWSRQKLREWNAASLKRVERCIHDVVGDRVRSRPDHEAICAWDGNLSFQQLDHLSTTLAHHLVGLGVGPETFVPLCFHKSKWAAVAVLAVLKAGGAFVPLDPAHPIPRLQSLSQRINANVMLCSRAFAGNLHTVASTVIPVDDDALAAFATSRPTDAMLPHVSPHHAAYIIFTSGTTGEPKGTVLEHAAYCSSANAHGPAIHIDHDSRVLQFAAYTFDSSLIEMLTPLMVGACVCIPSEEARMNDIASAMISMRVNLAILTPSFVSFLQPPQVPELKTLVLAGEAMSKEHIATWSHINLVNGYGPTETAVSAIINPSMKGRHAANVGRPVGGHCWIVDPDNHDRLLPIGCTGELLVEGPTLARGYLHDEKKTDDVFIRSLVWAPGRRFYKTGDLLRYNSDGTLHFIGRKDTQVKVHGQRVELGEIEHHLAADVHVKHGLILLPKEGPCKRKVVAVLSLADQPDGHPLELVTESSIHSPAKYIAALRSRLSTRLPTYMIPTIWAVVESIPLLTSGKLDRKRVGTWLDGFTDELYRRTTEVAQLDEETTISRPATEIETKIRQVWSYVLNLDLDQIGLNRSFLNLGGDSISAMQVMGRCQRLGIGLKVQEILRSKSIAELATYSQHVKQSFDYHEVPEQEFDLSPIQQHYFMLPNQGKGYFNQSVFLRITRTVSLDALQTAITTIVERHSMLRARFSRTGPAGAWRQRITDDVPQSYRLRHLHVNAREETTSHIATSHACLDAVRGPLLAADLFEINKGEQLLFLTANHLVIDLVSWRVVLEELEDILSNPSIPTLPSKTMPFQAWCRLQSEHAQTQSSEQVFPLAAHIQEHPCSQLNALDDVASGDFAFWGMESTPNNYGGVLSEGFELDVERTALVMNSCHKALRTEPVDILFAALLSSFAKVFPERNVPPLYTETHGREPWNDSIDISRTVGWFTSLYPVIVPKDVFGDVVDIVRHVKDLRRRIPGNGRPYFATRFLTAHGESAFQNHWPMEIAFNYLGQYQQLEREGALLQPVEELAGEARGAGGTADVGELAPRFALFEISAVVSQGKLRFSFTFNPHIRHQARFRRWISACSESLSFIAKKLSTMAPAPTLADFPLLSLSYPQLDLLVSQHLPKKGIQGFRDVEDIYPASPLQRGLLLSRMKNSNLYAVHGISEVVSKDKSCVDPGVLEDAWKMVVNRHATLRTVFAEGLDSSHGLYSQVILNHVQPDIIHLSSEDDTAALDILVNQRAVSYNEDMRPPHRLTICQTKDGKVFLRLEVSHTVVDGTSMSFLFRDLALAYEGRLAADPKPLFSDYIAHLAKQPVESGMQFWKGYLNGVEPCHMPILTDGVTATTKELRSLRVNFARLSELQAFGNAQGVTLSNIFHTAWAMTLRCFVGTDRPCFGYLASGRDASILHSEDAVGPFINMLACRLDLTPTTTLIDVLGQVQRDYAESIPHRNIPLADVQHALGLSGTPLFNTILSYRKLPPVDNSRTNAISFVERAANHDPTEYNVSINVEATDDAAYIDMYYWTDVLSNGQAENITSTFVRALENIFDHSDSPIGRLDILSDRNHDQITTWNRIMPSCVDRCIHWGFQEQAKLQPHAPAICGWDYNFTFEQLDSAANQVAHHLITLGVLPETYVPLCFDKSAWAVVAMLGVMKAGAACVPLDPTHPRSALDMRVRDVAATVVLTAPHYVDIFEPMSNNVVSISPSFVDFLPKVDEPACDSVQPHNAAYVIFTSGSTGKPKAVVLEHCSLMTSFKAHGSALQIGPNTRMLQFSAFTFDNSLEEIFTTLTRGGCVCIPSSHDRMNDLVGAINQLRVNFCCLTPTVASFLEPKEVPNVKDIALGGEPLTKKNIEVWSNSVRLHGQYGPSECSIDSAVHFHIDGNADPTNLGRSIGCVSWIVDQFSPDILVPVGCVGELVIEGPIVSRGYLNLPDKTAASFIEDPGWSLSQQLPWATISTKPRRMYKTGDLVRYNSDGTMSYLGRIDTQIKLRGQRIELGEIEHYVKGSLPEESQSAVELVSPSGKKALAVFFSVSRADQDSILLPMNDNTRALATTVETNVSAALAPYMVPSLYIPIAQMPLTVSGKTDRSILRSLLHDATEDAVAMYRLAGQSGRIPVTSTEKIIAALWEDILVLESGTVGVEDNFFRLGGDSVAAMRLVTAARLEGVSLAVADIFQTPKLEDMAVGSSLVSENPELEPDFQPFSLIATLENTTNLKAEIVRLCHVERDAIEDVYPCTAIQEGLMALSMKDPGAYVARNTYQLKAGVDLERFKQAWEAVVEEEPILRTRIVYVQDHGFFQAVIKEAVCWLNTSRFEEKPICPVPSYNGDNLTQYALVTEEKAAPRFLWTIHHALYDGWCFPMIIKRIEEFYRGAIPSPKVLRTPYKSFIAYLSEADMSESDDFWRTTLSNVSVSEFPALPHPAYQARATSLKERSIAILSTARSGITMASKIRSAWALAIAIFSGSEDVVFGESTTGRDAPVRGITDMVGPTLATIPSRVKINREETIESFLQRVQAQSALTLPFQHAGLQRIKRLGPEISSACNFQNLLAINYGADESLDENLWIHRDSNTVDNNFYIHPLMVLCTVRHGAVHVAAHYDQNVISGWQMSQLLMEFETLLQRLNDADVLHEKIGEMRLLGTTDDGIIKEWNSQPLLAVDNCAHHIFEEQAQKLPPDTEAVCSWDASFTYQRLDDLATILARFLQTLGVGPEVIVPLYFEKSAWAVVAILAVLKAGGAFVPLDLSAPVARLRSIVEDTNARIMLCSANHQIFCESLARKVIPIHQGTIDQMQQMQHLQGSLPRCSSRSAAYIIYTSGSTGNPKGTVVEHTAFCTAAASHGSAMRMGQSTRALQFSSFTFDVSLLEILTTLGLGGCVCIPSENARLNNITAVINEMRINWASLTPSFAQLIRPSAVPTLRNLALLGEAMSQTHLSTWADEVALQNAYGPTECAVITTVKDMNSSTEPINIGKPVGGRCWIVDKHNHNRLVPIGSVGELLVEGPVLAREYLHNKHKSNDVFVQNPAFTNKPTRMYKTGDLVKYDQNGDLLFLGRKDTQTKVRGQRLETGEVEFSLRTDPLVQHALAVVPSFGVCAKRLVAVLSLRDLPYSGTTSDALEMVPTSKVSSYLPQIRDHLREWLPPYMIPSIFMVLRSLPLLASGKLNRRKVVDWVENMSEEIYRETAQVENSDVEARSPESDAEKTLQQIWGYVLNLPVNQVPITRSFLHLGGDSISAMQVMARCRADGLGITVQDIIRSKSITELATRVTVTESDYYETEEVDKLFDLSPIQRLYFKSVGDTWQQFNQSVLLRIKNHIEPKTILDAITSVAKTHSMLRARFTKNNTGTRMQYIVQDASTSFRFGIYKYSGDINDNTLKTTIEETQKSLDVIKGPVFSVDVFESTHPASQLLSLAVHHLVIDVVSWQVILQDLEDILGGGKSPTRSSLPFQTWCRLQSQADIELIGSVYPSDEVPCADLAYWGMEKTQNLARDTITETFEVNANSTSKILDYCYSNLNAEPVDLFLASLLHSFNASFLDRECLPTIYNEGHGRETWDKKHDLSRTVGWFTTMCPIFSPSLAKGHCIAEWVRWVKELRSRVPGKGRPYFTRQFLNNEGKTRFSKHWPMEITFNYLGHFQQFARSDALLQPADGMSGQSVNAASNVGIDVPRFALFDISASVSNGALAFSFTFNRRMGRQAAIRQWISACQNLLQGAAEQREENKSIVSLSDFPLVPLAFNGIDQLAKKLSAIGFSALEQVEDVYPCSPMQQGILLSQIRNPEHYAYSSVFEARSTKEGTRVDMKALGIAWQSVVNHCPVLRTIFVDGLCNEGEIGQAVLKQYNAQIQELNCDTESGQDLLEDQPAAVYTNTKPPHQLTLCRSSTGRVFCKLEINHALVDGSSIPLLIGKLADAYENVADGGYVSHYRDYISHLRDTSQQDHLDYWKNYLADTVPCYFPTLNDGVHSAPVLRCHKLQLPRTTALHAFCAENEVTLSNALQLVWGLVLRSYTGSDDVCFGYLTSGRDAPVRGIEEAIGTFISILICRINLADELQLLRALTQIQADYINSIAHQSFSLAEVQHELGLADSGLFNSAFTFQNRSNARATSKSALVFDVLRAQDPSEYALTVNAEAYEASITVSFTYWSDKISDPQAVNLSHTFDHILQGLVKSIEQPLTVGQLDLLSDKGLNQILAWNKSLPPSVEQCIHDMIDSHAFTLPAMTPAICGWDASFTFVELQRITSLLASHLVELGVGPAVHVPLCFEKSAWYVVAMMAVMKAGGIFIPLDPTHPESRNKTLIETVDARLILCSRECEDKMSSISKTAIAVDRSFLKHLSSICDPLRSSLAAPQMLAYIIFTSGTTGLPKGTMIEHGAFCTSAIEHSQAFYITSTSRVYQFASYTFDASIMEIFTTLIVGGCVCVPCEEDRMNDIPGSIERMGANWLCLTPSVADTLQPEDLPSVRILVLAGEAMFSRHIAKWSGRKLCLINGYGPSEACVVATAGEKVNKDGQVVNRDPSNVGRAVGCRSWVTDPRNYNRLVPIGCVGELVVEGRTVGRGYLNDEEKTKESFINDALWLHRGPIADFLPKKERMYRTGDLVRYNTNGNLTFVSRKDTQIKYNGQRIELGEIQSHVITHIPVHSQASVELLSLKRKALAVFFTAPELSSSAVTSNVTDSTADDLLLPVSKPLLSIAKGIHNGLKSALPFYMIPSLYIPIAKLPCTLQGKLDRKRLRFLVENLPSGDVSRYHISKGSSGRQAPVTIMENKLQKAWASVLNLSAKEIGMGDDFFGLGGDSVLAMRLVSAARQEGFSLAVSDILRNPVLDEMARTCQMGEEKPDEVLRPFVLLSRPDSLDELLDDLAKQCNVPKGDIQDAYPCSPLQEGLITLSLKQPGAYIARNIFRLPKHLDLDRLKTAWERTVEELEILRTRIVHATSSSFLQVVLQNHPITWQVATSFLALPNETLQINGGELTRYTFIEDSESEERYLVWSIHHALYDGWSLPMILKRIENFYFDGAVDNPRGSYADFINYLGNTDVEVSKEFWRSRLLGCSPLHFPQASVTATEASRKSATLENSIELPERPAGFTVATIIRSSWALALSAYVGSEEVVFGETLSGRDIPVSNIAHIVGPTFTTVPNRVRVDQTANVKDYVENSRHMTAEAIPHQHMGLQHIRRLSSETAIACEFQNLLVIQSSEEEVSHNFMEPQHDGVGSNFFTYPLVIECSAGASRVRFCAYYDENYISTWEVQRLLYQFEHVLQQVCKSIVTGGKVADIQIFSAQDFELVSRWNNYEARVLDECLQDTFLKTAASQPNAPAVCAWDGQFTYGEVKEYAGRIAQRLIQVGAGPNLLVPFCMDKSAWNAVVILGILMSGAGFVPLDPSHPTSRHEEIIDDTKAQILLCSPAYKDRYSAFVGTVLDIDEKDVFNLPPCTKVSRQSCVTPSDVAYVIFTSGSTGKPKGVQIQHRAVSSSSIGYRDTLCMRSNSRVFQFASLCFDAAVMEILTTLTYGGCVCIPDDEERYNDLGGALARMEVSWAFFTPSVANIVDPASVPTLKTLVVGGELLPIKIINKWGDKVKLINAYGPTEASVITSGNFEIAQNRNVLNIGKPHTAGFAWIADPEDPNRLAPVGCTGELLLEGPFLSCGYLNDALKTAAAFIENPTWSSDFGKGPIRLYKTGDLARYSENGDLLFMGRKDGQVKLHGQRLELGEIEHRLEMDALIRHVLVTYPKTGLCKERLVAVLTFKELSSSELSTGSNGCQVLQGLSMEKARELVSRVRDSLSEQLPPYMVPTTWAVVERIPMLVSGKLDRKQVASWVQTLNEETHAKIEGIETPEDSTTPTSFTARLLRDIWARVLNLPSDKIKQEQSFISLGGDSITAMQVMSRCRKEKINLSLQDILKCKSVAHLAGLAGSGPESEIRDEAIEVAFDLSPIQQLYFQTHSDYSGSSRCNQSFSLRITKSVSAKEIDFAIQAIVQQHSMLRARFKKNSAGKWQQRIVQDVTSSYHFLQHNVMSHTIASLIANSQASLDIQAGPLLMVDLFNTENGEQILSMVAHHLVIDLVSWRIILGDLEEVLLTQTLAVDKSLSFQSWCALQTERSRQDITSVLPCQVPSVDVSFWGMVGKPNTYANVKRCSFEVGEHATRAVLRECNMALGTEPIDIFLAIIVHSFTCVFEGRSTPTVFNEGHGREAWSSSIDLSRTVGWFTTITPVHVDIDKNNDGIIDTVRRVKDLRRSTPGNGRPYFAQLFLAQEGHSKSQNQDMEIVFNYLGRMQQLEQAGALFKQVECFSNENEAKLMADVGPAAARFALFELSAAIVDNKIQFTFIFNREMQHQDKIQLWIAECKRTLEECAVQLSGMRPQQTLADYPLLPIDYKGLQKMVNMLPSLGIFSLDDVEDIYPCAPMQEGILLSQIKDPESYVMHTMYQIKSTNGSALDSAKILQAWQKVVDRHAALRTTFIDSVCKGGVFDQVVIKKADAGAIFLRCADSEVNEKLGSIKITETNWKKLPKLPHQLSLCETSTGRVVVKLEVNHAVIDGGSIFAMMQDLAAAYDNRTPTPPSLLYSDYIGHITRQPPDAGVRFWRGYLDNAQSCNFPSLNKNPQGERRLGTKVLEFNRFPKLVALCDKWGVTLSNLLQAVWALVLAHYTGSEDVCYGYLVSGRDAPLDGIEGAVGAFINMLVFRLKIDRAKTLEQLFLQVQSDFLKSLPFQHTSIAQLQHDLDLNGQNLFNTAVSIQNYQKSSDMEQASITFDQVTSHDPSEYVVTANILTSRNQEMVVFRYWTDKVSDDQAQDLSSVMATLLSDIIDRPQQTLHDLHLVPHGQNIKSPSMVSEAALRNMIGQSVREAIEQLFTSGELLKANATLTTTIANHRLNGVLELGQSIPSTPGFTSDSPSVEYPSDPAETPDSFTDEEIDGLHAKRLMHELSYPSGSTEKLRQLWSTFLRKDLAQIKNDSGFFNLGGDSIIAMRMAGAAREEGLTMKVADVFKNPTFADMAAKVMMADDIDSVLKNQIKRNSLAIAPTANSMMANDPYERYSLLKLSNVEAFLQERICPKVGIFRGGILDVFPVTNFQALAVTGVLLESKWMLNYFFLDGCGRVDIQRLKRATFRVVQAFDIFRTVFINYDDQFLQVVLRKLLPEFVVYEIDQDLDEYTVALQRKDKELGPRLGEPFVQFTVLKQKNTKRHRIILRMSHAQYDGVCLGRIFTGLQAAYQGESIPPSPPFANYVRDSAGGISSEHYNYWGNFLKGAVMTEVVPKDSPNYRNPTSDAVVLRKILRLASPTFESITIATTIKAAWSLVLSQITGSDDIIFGNVISGRNAAVLGVENIIGPCVNLVPVRVKFESGWTVLDLLRCIQEQQVAGMSYESLGFRDIIKHCTEWPDWMHFSTIVQHQNVDPGTKFCLGDNQYTMGSLGTQENLTDIVVLSTPLSNGDVEITLSYSADCAIPASFAATAFERLCDMVQSFASSPSLPLPSRYLANVASSHASPIFQDVSSSPRLGRLSTLSTVETIDRKLLMMLSDMLMRLWSQVLGSESSHLKHFRIDSNFFDLGGDLIAMAALASLLEHETGVRIKVEELIEYPVLVEQLALLANRQAEMRTEQQGWVSDGAKPVSISLSSVEEKRGRKLWRMRSDLAKKVKGKGGKRFL